MNDELKEILDYLKDEENTRRIKCITIEESKQLLDYITNLQHQLSLMEEDIRESKEINGELQQENERLKENNNKAMNDYVHAIDESWYRELYGDYKSRCEKAIEYINTHYEIVNGEKLLNILQNGSEKMSKAKRIRHIAVDKMKTNNNLYLKNTKQNKDKKWKW